MKTYLVGGAVRDELLGLPVEERDWVVVGSDAEAMRAQGFVPADHSFPVFLHPQTGEEYALARREVKRGEGYRGFEVYAGPDVTLEEDLRRRDLTINAIARDADGSLIDPYGGRDDLAAGLLRHVSPAFIEDPLRVLRVARFAARLGRLGFRVAHGTHHLMQQMVQRGDMAHLSAERLWREMHKAMLAEQPWRFFEVLQHCGALQVLIPALAAAIGDNGAHGDGGDGVPIAALKRIARGERTAPPRLAAALLGCVTTPVDAERLGAELRADRDTLQLLRRGVAGRALWSRAEHGDVTALYELARLWKGFDAHSDIDQLAAVCAAQSPASRVADYLAVALPAARAISAVSLGERAEKGAALGRALAEARHDAMAAALRSAGLVP